MNLPDNLAAYKWLGKKPGIFQDRSAAGGVLADMLVDYKGLKNAQILAIPAGGVPVGLQLHLSLMLPLELIIIRKIQIPGNTEAGFGALAQTGDCLLNQELIARIGLTEQEIEAQVQKTRQELASKQEKFCQGRSFPDLAGKTVILTDDGLASGFSMLAAAQMVQKYNPREIVVAVPTAPLKSVQKLSPKADKIFCAHIQDSLPFAVANAYQNWHDLAEATVQELLEHVQDQHGW